MSNLSYAVNYVLNLVGTGLNDEEGQGLIEYVLIGALISIIAIVAITAVGQAVGTRWTEIQTALTPGA